MFGVSVKSNSGSKAKPRPPIYSPSQFSLAFSKYSFKVDEKNIHLKKKEQ